MRGPGRDGRWRPPTRNQAILLAAVVLVTALGALGIVQLGTTPTPPTAPQVAATGPQTPPSGLPVVAVADLPAQARDTLALIDHGGPFPYRQDGTVFGNLERRLPDRPRGYYREYTVPTPGSNDRGVRRLVVGAGGDVYYTADHYGSFRQVHR